MKRSELIKLVKPYKAKKNDKLCKLMTDMGCDQGIAMAVVTYLNLAKPDVQSQIESFGKLKEKYHTWPTRTVSICTDYDEEDIFSIIAEIVDLDEDDKYCISTIINLIKGKETYSFYQYEDYAPITEVYYYDFNLQSLCPNCIFVLKQGKLEIIDIKMDVCQKYLVDKSSAIAQIEETTIYKDNTSMVITPYYGQYMEVICSMALTNLEIWKDEHDPSEVYKYVQIKTDFFTIQFAADKHGISRQIINLNVK